MSGNGSGNGEKPPTEEKAPEAGGSGPAEEGEGTNGNKMYPNAQKLHEELKQGITSPKAEVESTTKPSDATPADVVLTPLADAAEAQGPKPGEALAEAGLVSKTDEVCRILGLAPPNGGTNGANGGAKEGANGGNGSAEVSVAPPRTSSRGRSQSPQKQKSSLDMVRKSIENMRPRGGYMDEEMGGRGNARKSVEVTRARVSVEMRRNPRRSLEMFNRSSGGGGNAPETTRRSHDMRRQQGDLTEEEMEIIPEEQAIRAEIQAIGHTPNHADLDKLVELQERLEAITTKKRASMELGRYKPDEFSEFEMEDAQDLLNVKIAAATSDIKGTGLQRLMGYHAIQKWVDDAPVNEIVLLAKLVPVAVVFLAIIIGASNTHFDAGAGVPGQLYTLTPMMPMMWPMKGFSHKVEAIFSIPAQSMTGTSPAPPGGGGHRRSEVAAAEEGVVDENTDATHTDPTHTEEMATEHVSVEECTEEILHGGVGGHRRRRAGRGRRSHLPPSAAVIADEHTVDGPHGAETLDGENHGVVDDHADNETVHDPCAHLRGPTPTVRVYLMQFGDDNWRSSGYTYEELLNSTIAPPISIANWTVALKEQQHLIEFDLSDHPEQQYVVMLPTDAMGVGIKLHSLGLLGPHQVGLGAGIMIFVFLMIMTEVLHRTLAAMIGAALVMIVLACQNRAPTLGRLVAWMDHGTLGLLWGMMLIVGITMRTGVFEWTGVLACKMAKGSKIRLLLLLCTVTAVLSAFLDNVTTILLIAPVTCKLCKLVDIDPRPFLISECIFSNIGGTSTMIGDPPNIIVGNMLSDVLDFTAFLVNLAPGVIFTSPFIFMFLWWYYRAEMRGTLEADVPALQKMYPITNKALLIKCGVVLGCVILCFFLHPVTHVDPAFVSILGAVWLLVAFDLHHCHEALMGVEWDTLLFFAALFVVVEGVGELGLLRAIAALLSDLVATVPVESRQAVAIIIIVWASAIFSAFVDNIPFTATMVPVMQQMVRDVEGIHIEPLAWALCFGACFGGNGTLIGASANIVMASKAEVEGFPVSFVSFIKIGFPVMLLSVALATCYLMFVNGIIWVTIFSAESAMNN